jgi:hypothetical protein
MNALSPASQGTPTVATIQPGGDAPSNRRVHRVFHSSFVIIPLATALALLTSLECGGSLLHPSSLIYGGVLWSWWAIFAIMLGQLAPRLPLIADLSVKAVFVHLAAGSMCALIHLFILWGIGFPLGWGRPDGPAFMWAYLFNINRFGIEFLIYAFIVAITGVVQYQVRAQRESLRSLDLERQLSIAHLRALQAQLEPHFLFNTLNAITTLVELGRQQQAVAMLAHLNVILKSTLKRSAPEKVPLAQELEMIDNYLAIEQIRFADRLQVQIKVDPGALDGMVPCFLLQPIVENAIRHGIAHCVNEGKVEASARRDGASLHLKVRDTGAETGKPAQDGHGIGLRNTRERLMHFYNDEFAMKAQPLDEGGFEVAITIPYEPQGR